MKRQPHRGPKPKDSSSEHSPEDSDDDSSDGGSSEPSQSCIQCRKELTAGDRVVFVEEDVGRIFCSETCIVKHFEPDIGLLEADYQAHFSPSDLDASEREALGHLRWTNFEKPTEIWKHKAKTGDTYYTLVNEFSYKNNSVWSVSICLFLRGEPSFLLLSFVTKDKSLLQHFSKGEKVDWVEKTSPNGEEVPEQSMDRQAEPWTHGETYYAKLWESRSLEDISAQDFQKYDSHLEETLETPDELWTFETPSRVQGRKEILYHFIKSCKDETPHVWYVIVARETKNEDELEIVDAFPTKDPDFLEQFRIGELEVGETDIEPQSKIVH